MASKTVVTDDLDGSEGATTTRIAFGDEAIDIDLTAANLAKYRKMLAPLFDVGREVTRKGGNNSETTQAREWLQAHGHKVGEKGRIPEDLMAIYRANAGSLYLRLWASAQGRKNLLLTMRA